jgi:tetratricopeptide (TPR) repeat protein
MARRAGKRFRPGDPPSARGPFLQRIQALLENTPHEQLKGHLLARATGLPAGERLDFLRMLGEGEPRPSRSGPGLLANVDAFAAALRRDEYADDAWADEPEWVDDFEALLSGATRAFVDGERTLAAEALGRLLRVFDLEGEVAAFCGDEPAELRVRSDLGEALAFHLRALYDTTPLQRRAAKLLEEIIALHGIGSTRAGLEAIRNADPDAPADWVEFLPEWIDSVRRLDPDPDDVLRDMRGFLLREATRHVAGADGLGELARREGRDDPQNYHEWLDALLDADRREDAVAAAREAVGAVAEPWKKARLADRLTTLALDMGDEALALEAGRTAWRSLPSPRRLTRLCGVVGRDGESLRSSLAAEREAARSDEFQPGDRLAAILDLLLGDLDSAMNRLERAPALGWGGGDHPGRIVFPCAMLAAAGLAAPPERSVLAVFWKEIDGCVDLDDFPVDESDRLDDPGPGASTVPAGSPVPGGSPAPSGSPAPGDPAAAAAGSTDPPTLSDLLSASLGRLDLAPAARRRVVERLRGIVETRVDAIVSNRHRRAYLRAARLAAAWAEGAALAGNSHSGQEFLKTLLERFPRHSAFKREIDSVARDMVAARR